MWDWFFSFRQFWKMNFNDLVFYETLQITLKISFILISLCSVFLIALCIHNLHCLCCKLMPQSHLPIKASTVVMTQLDSTRLGALYWLDSTWSTILTRLDLEHYIDSTRLGALYWLDSTWSTILTWLDLEHYIDSTRLGALYWLDTTWSTILTRLDLEHYIDLTWLDTCQ